MRTGRRDRRAVAPGIVGRRALLLTILFGMLGAACSDREPAERATIAAPAGTAATVSSTATPPVVAPAAIPERRPLRTRVPRERAVRPEVAQRRAEVAARREQWRQRIESLRSALRAIESDPSLDDAAKRAAIAKLLQEGRSLPTSSPSVATPVAPSVAPSPATTPSAHRKR